MPVLLEKQGQIVGGGFYGVAVAGVGVRIAVAPGQPAQYPVKVVVRGCNGEQGSSDWPDDRPALPVGAYQAIAVIEDHPIGREDPADGQLVSSPVSVYVGQ